ncbi:transcription termination/antitermination protein NusG [Chengkuizengella sp. SCS-71B]|uniref:transcription termination/antitermination protein NusG n=1 Tax=Chengkuizengella sp. SCS-71B TaxID=3115290 RepID=UPI0032C22826
MEWYAVKVLKNEEKYVAKLISPFVDEVKKFTKMTMVKTRKGMKCVSVPMLPGYILIKVDMTDKKFSTINNLPYVINVITDSKLKPITIKEEAIHQLERRIYNENIEQCKLSDLSSDLLASNAITFNKNNNFYM